MNTFAASTRRIPRPALIGIVALIAAFAALMVVRSGVLGGSSTDSTPIATPADTATTTPPRTTPAKPAAKPKLVLVAGLPTPVAHALRYSKIVVVSLYAGTVKSDRTSIAAGRAGARSAGAGFVAINTINDKNASTLVPFVGSVSTPTMLVVRRPGKIVARFEGVVDDAVVAQAAHNAGARRR